MTDQQIIAELDRIERELHEQATRSQGAVKEAIRIIENLMADLGIPLAKESADA
jgi:hypothetical protein